MTLHDCGLDVRVGPSAVQTSSRCRPSLLANYCRSSSSIVMPAQADTCAGTSRDRFYSPKTHQRWPNSPSRVTCSQKSDTELTGSDGALLRHDRAAHHFAEPPTGPVRPVRSKKGRLAPPSGLSPNPGAQRSWADAKRLCFPPFEVRLALLTGLHVGNPDQVKSDRNRVPRPSGGREFGPADETVVSGARLEPVRQPLGLDLAIILAMPVKRRS